MALPKFLQPYLASYDLSKLDENNESVQKELVSQVLNLGDQKAVRWIFKNYPRKLIKETLEQPLRGIWFYDSLLYWQKIFDIRIREDVFELAIINLNPNPKLYEKLFDQDVSS